MFASKKIAIDLGTANSVVYVEGQGVILQEPTVVAIEAKQNKVLAVGKLAKDMLGKAPPGIIACRPMQLGSIAHYRATEALIKRFIGQAMGNFRLIKPEVIISVPAGLSSVEERAVMRALYTAGAGQIYLLPEPLAAAVGAGLPLESPAGNMILNIGGGTAEIAVISLNDIVSSESHKGAGDAVTEAIQQHLRRAHNLAVGEQSAEWIKHELANAFQPEGLELEVRGTDTRTNLPINKVITDTELEPVIREVLKGILQSLARVLEQTPPELAADVMERGVVMSGGTALLKGADRFFTRAVGVPFHVADDPLLCVTRGLVEVLKNLDDYKRNLV